MLKKFIETGLVLSQVFEVPSQQILTTDSVTLTVDAVVYYRLSPNLIFVTSTTSGAGVKIFRPASTKM